MSKYAGGCAAFSYMSMSSDVVASLSLSSSSCYAYLQHSEQGDIRPQQGSCIRITHALVAVVTIVKTLSAGACTIAFYQTLSEEQDVSTPTSLYRFASACGLSDKLLSLGALCVHSSERVCKPPSVG